MSSVAHKILVVDDEPEARQGFEYLFRREGYQVLSTGGGRDALRLARQEHPHLVLLDVCLPDMPGTEVLKALRSDPDLQSAWVLLMSSLCTDSETQAEGLGLGAHGYIARPISNRELLARVKQLLSQGERLRADEARFRELIHQMADAVLVVDTLGTVCFANPQAVRLFGRPDLNGLPFGHPLSEEVAELELPHKGEVRFAELRATRTLWDGQPAYLVSLRDITARKLMEARLQERTRLLQMASRLAGIGAWSCLTDLRVSEELAALLDLPPGEMPLESWWERFEPADRDRLRSAFQACAAEGRSFEDEGTILTGREQRRRVRIVGELSLDEAGDPLCPQGVLQDIEEYRRLESLLRQSQKLEAIGRLAGGVAHDFNNQMTVVLSNASLLEESLSGEEAECLREIVAAAERSAALTRQLLAFARQAPAAPRALDVNSTIEELLKMLRRLIGEHVTLSWKPARGLWSVRLDPTQLHQILTNLAVNARDAVGQKGTIELETANVSLQDVSYAPSGDYVMVRFADDGCGMADEDLAKVFEPFYTTKPFGQGSGLGLAIIHGVVQQNRGVIRVSSQVGRGTTFQIYFPRCALAQDARPGRAEPAQACQETIPRPS